MGTFFEDITWPSGLERSVKKSFLRLSESIKKDISITLIMTNDCHFLLVFG